MINDQKEKHGGAGRVSHAEHFFINFVGIEVTFLLFSPLSRLAAVDLEVILRRFCHTVRGRGCTCSAWLLLHGTFDFFVMFVGFFFFHFGSHLLELMVLSGWVLLMKRNSVLGEPQGTEDYNRSMGGL